MSDIIKKLTDTKFGAPATVRSPAIAKLTAYKAPGKPTTVSPIVAKLAKAGPIAPPEPKQEGPITVAMFTPYSKADMDVVTCFTVSPERGVGPTSRVVTIRNKIYFTCVLRRDRVRTGA